MTTEFGFPPDERSLGEDQLRLEKKAQARHNAAKRDIDAVTLPRTLGDALGTIFSAIRYRRAADWLSRVENVRHLQMVSSNPEVIMGTLGDGQQVFLSSYRTSFGPRQIFGTVENEPLSMGAARKLLRQTASVLRERNKEQYRGS